MTRNLPGAALLMTAVVTAAMGYPCLAHPAESSGSLLNDSFMISLGTFMLATKTKVTLNGSAGTPGTEVDFDKDLGLSDTDRFRLDATWRFAQRHKLRAMYFSTSQSATKGLQRSVTIGDTVYPIAAQASTDHSTTIAELAYEYVFWRKDNYEITGSAGIHSVKFDFAVSGNGSVGGQSSQFRRETAVAQAPLPVFGLRGLWEFSPQWYLDGQAQYFSLNYGDFDGSVSDLRIGVTRMFGEHFGVGAGWNEFITEVGIDKSRFDGELNWRYSGAQIYLTASF